MYVLNIIKKWVKPLRMYSLLYIVVGIFVFHTNYTHGTYLIGWDNLQTDLNPVLGIRRAFFSVWQEYQSFGLISGMAHAADLPRAIFIWLLSLIMSQNLIRYFFHVSMWTIGGIGMHTFIDSLVSDKKQAMATYVGGLFYMLNFGVVQIFYLPWEAFSVFFGFLPWLLWSFNQNLEDKHANTRHIIVFGLLNILAAPQYYVQTIFLVYIAVLGIFWLGRAVHKHSYTFFKSSFVLGGVILFVNLYWLLPQGYFFHTSKDAVVHSKINALSTDDTIYQNKEKGTLDNYVRMEGFYYETQQDSLPIFQPWKVHFSNSAIYALPILFFLLSLAGLFFSGTYRWPLLGVWLLTSCALLNSTPVFAEINNFVRQVDLINQIFRSPFTKFVIPHALVSAVLLSFGITGLASLLSKHIRKKLSLGIVSAFITILLCLYALPVFQGQLFSSDLKVAIPDDYLKTIEFFKTIDKKKRIGLLPEYTFWGWYVNQWGYMGSGFLWYGLEQPVVSRTFDPWSLSSESYFWELRYALNSVDLNLLHQVLAKYNIDYMVLDSSIIPISSSHKAIQYEQIDALIAQSSHLEIEKKWNNITIISVKGLSHARITESQNLPKIGPVVNRINYDPGYSEYANYVAIDTNADIYYPFIDMFTDVDTKDKHWSIQADANVMNIISQLPDTNLDLYKLISTDPQPLIEFVTEEGNVKKYNNTFIPTKGIDTVEVMMDNIVLKSFKPNDTTINKCQNNAGKIDSYSLGNNLYILSEDGATACFSFYAPNLDHRYGYLIQIENNNVEGRRLFFYTIGDTNKNASIEDRMSSDFHQYILPPSYFYGKGYSFSFVNNSYFFEDTENVLRSLKISYLPVNAIKNIQVIKNNLDIKRGTLIESRYQQSNYYSYKVQPSKATIYLSQSYHPGWLAYSFTKTNLLNELLPFFRGTKIEEHVKVNNWANGWIIPDSEKGKEIIIVFWPQYLQYLGFVFLILTPISLFMFGKMNTKSV